MHYRAYYCERSTADSHQAHGTFADTPQSHSNIPHLHATNAFNLGLHAIYGSLHVLLVIPLGGNLVPKQ